MKPMAAAALGALIAGVGMYAVGARAQNSPFADVPALVQTVDGQFVRIPGVQSVASAPVAYTNALQSPAPVMVRATAAPQRTVYRTVTPASSSTASRSPVTVDERPTRSWKKTAMVIGGSTAGGAGIGGLVGGKKGALIGAALGGGAASIYEAAKR